MLKANVLVLLVVYFASIKLVTSNFVYFQAGFTLGNIVGMYLAQNYEVSFIICPPNSIFLSFTIFC